MSQREPTPGRITVQVDDLALILYLPDPSVQGGRCTACDLPAGAHYCVPREGARHRLERAVLDTSQHHTDEEEGMGIPRTTVWPYVVYFSFVIVAATFFLIAILTS